MNQITAAQTRQKNPPPEAKSGLLQHACACGQHTGGGECAECRKKRLGLQRQAAGESSPATAPPIVHEVLRTPGRPLDATTRAYMEPRFGHDFSQVQVHTDVPEQIQARLTVNQPGDRYEQEADRVAEQVMRMQAPGHLQRRCVCGGTPGPVGECAECRKKRMTGQRPVKNQTEPTTVPPIVHEVLRSPSRPLDQATRSFMEPRFGHGFSNVRVHTDEKAAESARAVNALAYTVVDNLVFGAGEYQPHTEVGRRLIAHELVHVVQQGGCSRLFDANVYLKTPNNAIESKTEDTAEKLVAGEPVQVTSTPPAVHLQSTESASGVQVCGGVNNFFRTVLLIDPSTVSDGITCLCLGVGIADLLPIPGVGTNPVVEYVDCACNILTVLQEIFNRGSDGGCWEIANLSTIDILSITALAELAMIDCGSLPIGTALGGLIGGLIGGGSGGAVGGPPGAVGGAIAGGGVGVIIGDFIVDAAAMAFQNLIIQGTPLPAAQAAACSRLVTSPRLEPGDFPSTPEGSKVA